MPENPYAFPQAIATDGNGRVVISEELGHGGMNLRDWFAGQALIGLLVLQSSSQTARSVFETMAGAGSGVVTQLMAGMAYDYADAMLVQREKKTEAPS